MDEQRKILKEALLQFDTSLTEANADYIVSDILENVDFNAPNIAQHSLQWIAEHYFKSHYLHAGW